VRSSTSTGFRNHALTTRGIGHPLRPSGRESDEVMCEKCNELDDKIARYKRLAVQITDKLTLDGIDQLISRLKSEKVDLQGERHQE
jgi:hypothetical protein